MCMYMDYKVLIIPYRKVEGSTPLFFDACQKLSSIPKVFKRVRFQITCLKLRACLYDIKFHVE